jgi:hypothetical protein
MREVILTGRPRQGAGVHVSEHPGDGTIISSTGTDGFSPDCTGILAWNGTSLFCYDTTDCVGGVIDGGNASG